MADKPQEVEDPHVRSSSHGQKRCSRLPTAPHNQRIDASSSASASSLSLRSLLIPKATLNTTTTPTPTLPKPQITGTLSLSFLSSNAIVCGQGKRDFEDRRSWTQLCLHCTSQELHARDCYSGTKHWKFCSVQLITLPTSICGPSDVFSSLSYFGAVKQLELDSIHSFQRTKDLMTEAMFSLNTMTEDGNIKEVEQIIQVENGEKSTPK
ncbi:unnamed protein product [Prunus armeniaca]